MGGEYFFSALYVHALNYCVFCFCSPTHPLRPSTPNLHPSGPCIPSIAAMGLWGITHIE